MSFASTRAEPCALDADAHAETTPCANVTLNTRIGDAFAPRSDEAFRVLDETCVFLPPALPMPPADLETRRTDVWVPVRFLGEPVRMSADRPLPRDCPHAIAEALERATRNLTGEP